MQFWLVIKFFSSAVQRMIFQQGLVTSVITPVKDNDDRSSSAELIIHTFLSRYRLSDARFYICNLISFLSEASWFPHCVNIIIRTSALRTVL